MTTDLSALIQALRDSEDRAAKNFPALRLGPWPKVPIEERLQAARRLQEQLSCVPLYAKRAARAREQGDEMAYWLELQSSRMTAHRR